MIALLVIKEWDVALGVGLLDGIAKMGAYFLHERIWARVKWGAPKRPDYEI